MTQKKTALITGCSAHGIGSALAQAFHARGVHVFATARSLTKMSHLAKEYPDMTLLELDVTSPQDIEKAVATVRAHTGGTLDFLVNNSGVPLVRPALETDLAEARALFEVNFWGVVRVTSAFAELVVNARGVVVNVGSLGGNMGVVWNSFYAASKAALKSYGETLRLELAPFGVRVVTIMSGVVGTNIFTRHPELNFEGSMYEPATEGIRKMAAGAKIKDPMAPSEYAAKVVDDLLAGKNGLVWRGRAASIGWFLTTWMPQWVLDWIGTTGMGLDKLGK
ncbi:SDR family oxidoreductase [Aspergillus homomorphus CBS 101889]|uniref:NAD(P)-binding protein n=1 Tax=Aspergillus homomorphus (strain CBS 101889) TaxID=1450537 RepID=A0A395I0F4_ASPHC|nr:NAD(P)-binding protein [Aspergillus homomorphus CBS 101889]RAL13417.1 NAD(P)-binding protein [Aspergillus homomorphus CBS 101889]